MSEEVGLRERKKAATRSALCAAANRLAIEHGVEHVTVEAIAAEADVSPRTFHNYFSSREEAIVASVVDYGRRLTDRLSERPADEPIWDALNAVMADSVDGTWASRTNVAAQLEMIVRHPSLLASHLAALDEMRRRVAGVIAERSGTDADHDLYPQLVAGAAAHAMKTASDVWAASSGERALVDLVNEAFAMMRAGLPEPRPGRLPSANAAASSEPAATQEATP